MSCVSSEHHNELCISIFHLLGAGRNDGSHWSLLPCQPSSRNGGNNHKNALGAYKYIVSVSCVIFQGLRFFFLSIAFVSRRFAKCMQDVRVTKAPSKVSLRYVYISVVLFNFLFILANMHLCIDQSVCLLQKYRTELAPTSQRNPPCFPVWLPVVEKGVQPFLCVISCDFQGFIRTLVFFATYLVVLKGLIWYLSLTLKIFLTHVFCLSCPLCRLRVFDSGVMVVQLQSHSEEEMIASALDNVSCTSMNNTWTTITW